jgi:signal transduction histidine kinase/ActR/RegA family two-component response regulator
MFSADMSSIRKNFMVVVLATTFAALFVAATALLIYEARAYRQSGFANLQTQAELVARTAGPALAFDDRSAAAASLNLLRFRKDILAAALFTSRGNLFATYRRSDDIDSIPTLPEWSGTRVESHQIVVVHRIVENGVAVGTLYLRGQYELWNRLFDQLIILGSVMLGSLLVALLISTWLQRAVTRPIVALTGAARKVVEERDFSQRVPKTTGGEIGILVDAFNTMLAEVGERASELEESNEILRRESADRAAAEAALRLADKRKDEFLAMLAHELRNPLAPITNALAILQAAPLDSGLGKLRDIIERQLRQLVRLVDDLLDVSRITTGKLVLRREVVDLVEVVQGAAETARPLLEARNHRLCLNLPPHPVSVNADGLRLAQVISNLLNNSAKYSEPGGRIEVHVEAGNEEVSVRVVDGGIGIAAEVLPEVFDMFRQADTSIERIQSGLGVGLSLAKRLVELHEGTISAFSAGLGKGSEFVVRLPIVKVSSQFPQPTSSPRDVAHLASRRIMVVDDNRDFAETLAALLRQLGHEVRVAHDAAQALKQAAEFAPDLGFVDIGLPGMNGYELARRLRSLPETARTVLVAATGYGQAKDREQSREAGFDRHIVKPVDLATVQSILAAFSADPVRQYDLTGRVR